MDATVLKDLESEDALEPLHYYRNIRAESLYTLVSDLLLHNFHFYMIKNGIAKPKHSSVTVKPQISK